MPRYSGKTLLLKVGDGGSPTEVFSTVGVMTSTGLSLSKETIDVTSKDDLNWRQLLGGSGTVAAATISASGIISDSATHGLMKTLLINGTLRNFEVTSGRGDKFKGLFQVTAFEQNGEHNAAEQWSVTLESAGDITYTPAP